MAGLLLCDRPGPAAAQTAHGAGQSRQTAAHWPTAIPDLQGIYDLATLTPLERPRGARAA